MKKRDLKIVLAWILLITYAVIIGSACTTESKVKNWLRDHQLKQAEWCAEKYPVKTEYVKGEAVVKTDTTFVKGDSIPCPETVPGKLVKVKCPDSKTIYSTITRIDTVVKENTAKASYYKGLYDLETIEKIKSEEREIKARKTAENRLKWIVFLIGGLVISTIIHFRKNIFPFL